MNEERIPEELQTRVEKYLFFLSSLIMQPSVLRLRRMLHNNINGECRNQKVWACSFNTREFRTVNVMLMVSLTADY